MTALYIVGGIAAFIAFLLACPVTLRAAFRDEFSARAGYLFFHYTIAPRPPRKKEAKPQKEEKPEKSKLRLLLEQKGLSGFLSILQEAAKIASGMAKRLFSTFRLILSGWILQLQVMTLPARLSHMATCAGSSERLLPCFWAM